jgi:putative transposase
VTAHLTAEQRQLALRLKARRKVGKPRGQARPHQPAVRFPAPRRFRGLPDGRRSLPKLGALKLCWSRPLPADRSRVTVTWTARAAPPLSSRSQRCRGPRWTRRWGCPRPDQLRGLSRRGEGRHPALAAAAGEGAGPFPAQHGRQAAGRKHREQARRRPARLAATRRDCHQQLATRLVREHQPVGVEPLTLAGRPLPPGHARPRRRVGQGTAMLEDKAALDGRQVVKVDPWSRSSQVCSACGHRAGPTPLLVGSWTCPRCGVAHDRDRNASKNLVGAGLALAGCGVGARPGATPAVDAEAGTALAGAA